MCRTLTRKKRTSRRVRISNKPNRSRVNLCMDQFCRLSKRTSSWTSNAKSSSSCLQEPNRFWLALNSRSCVFSKTKVSQFWSESKSSTTQTITVSMKLHSNNTTSRQAPNQNLWWLWFSKSTVPLARKSRVTKILIVSLIQKLMKWVSISRGMMTTKSSKITRLESRIVLSLSVKSSLMLTSLTATTQTKTKMQMPRNCKMAQPRLRIKTTHTFPIKSQAMQNSSTSWMNCRIWWMRICKNLKIRVTPTITILRPRVTWLSSSKAIQEETFKPMVMNKISI